MTPATKVSSLLNSATTFAKTVRSERSFSAKWRKRSAKTLSEGKEFLKSQALIKKIQQQELASSSSATVSKENDPGASNDSPRNSQALSVNDDGGVSPTATAIDVSDVHDTPRLPPSDGGSGHVDDALVDEEFVQMQKLAEERILQAKLDEDLARKSSRGGVKGIGQAHDSGGEWIQNTSQWTSTAAADGVVEETKGTEAADHGRDEGQMAATRIKRAEREQHELSASSFEQFVSKSSSIAAVIESQLYLSKVKNPS